MRPWARLAIAQWEDPLIISILYHNIIAYMLQGISKQAATGRTKDNTVFPLTVKFTDVSQNLSVGDLYSPSCTMDKPLMQPPSQVSTSAQTIIQFFSSVSLYPFI